MDRVAIPDALRVLVRQRAGGRCEYCLLHENDSLAGHAIDHVIARKHRGATAGDNLALACAECNRYKGRDIATLDPVSRQLTRLFDPRRDLWSDHSALDGALIERPRARDRGTARLLQFNEPVRVQHRMLLQAQGRYPHAD